ncbi:HAD domain-containing protein [Curtobacterium citreum]
MRCAGRLGHRRDHPRQRHHRGLHLPNLQGEGAGPRLTEAVLFLDIDRVLLPIHDTTAWPDYTTIDSPYGDVPMSPRLLAAVGALPARIVYITDWQDNAKLLDVHLGRTDSEVVHRTSGDGWWKTRAVADYLAAHPDVGAVIHADDHLSIDDRENDLTHVAAHRPHLAVISEDGLTPEHVAVMEAFLAGFGRGSAA